MSEPGSIQPEVIETWRRSLIDDLPPVQRIDVRALLDRAERVCAEDVQLHLQFWLDLIDEALHYLLQLYRFTTRCFITLENKIHGRAFLALVARSCALTVSIRRLVLAGLEDAARPVARSLIETMDLALVCCTDMEFVELYDEEPWDYDPNEFWKKQIAFGRLNARLKRVLEHAGFTAAEVEVFLQDRATAKDTLSGAAHSSIHSALRSFFVPSIRSSDMYSAVFVGHVSELSPNLLSFVINSIHEFGAIVSRLITDNPAPIFQNCKMDDAFHGHFATFFALQELVLRYRDQLPPGEALDDGMEQDDNLQADAAISYENRNELEEWLLFERDAD